MVNQDLIISAISIKKIRGRRWEFVRLGVLVMLLEIARSFVYMVNPANLLVVLIEQLIQVVLTFGQRTVRVLNHFFFFLMSLSARILSMHLSQSTP